MAELLSSQGNEPNYQAGECQNNICDEKFVNMKNSTVHEAIDKKEQHDCKKWDQSFPLGSDLSQHISKVHRIAGKRGSPSFTLICIVCGKQFASRKGLIEHIRFIHKKETKSCCCDICGKEFGRRRGLREHIRFVHKKEKNFSCEFCTKTFSRSNSLNKHITDLHEQSGSFSCGFCDKKFSRLREKIVHEKKHTGEKPFHCKNCNKGCSQYMAKKSKFNCETCHTDLIQIHAVDEKQTSDRADKNLVNEMKDVSVNTDDDISQAYSKAIWNLVHDKTDVNLDQEKKNRDLKPEEQHACNKCSKSFPLLSKLNHHIGKFHSFLAERGISLSNLVCNMCGKKFFRRKNLVEHIKFVHEKENKYPCQFCDQQFARKPSLINHERIHTGEKPYQCKTCDKQYSRHMARKAKFQCETCHSALGKVQKQHFPVNDEKPDSLDNINGEISDHMLVSDEKLVDEKKAAKVDLNFVKETTSRMTHTGIIQGKRVEFTDENFVNENMNENNVCENTDENYVCDITDENFVHENTDENFVHEKTDENFVPENTIENSVHEDTEDNSKVSNTDEKPVDANKDESQINMETCDFISHVNEDENLVKHFLDEDLIENETIKVEENDQWEACNDGTSLLSLYKQKYAAIQDRKDLIDLESKVINKSELVNQIDEKIEILEGDTKCENLSSDNVKTENLPSDVDKSKLRDKNKIHGFLDKSGFPSSTLICSVCHKKFGRRKNLKEHVRFVHEKEKNFLCDHCNKLFARKSSLKSHIADIHEQNGSFVCMFCNKRYFKERDKEIHERIHTGEKPYQCEQCGSNFKTKASLDVHMHIHSKVLEFQCVDCGKQFRTKGSLERHTQIHINEFPCNICDSKFNCKRLLQEHMMIHSGVRAFKCFDCDRQFLQNVSLNHHVYTNHLDGLPCRICDKRIKDRSHLTEHLKSEATRNKPKKKSSSLFDENKISLRIAKPRKPKSITEKILDERIKYMMKRENRMWLCKLCDVMKTKKSNITSHIETSHLENSINCNFCETVLKNRPALATHVRSKHTTEVQ